MHKSKISIKTCIIIFFGFKPHLKCVVIDSYFTIKNRLS